MKTPHAGFVRPRLAPTAVRRISWLVAATLGLAALGTCPAQTLDRSIPLDCGGWLSGFSIHSSGRLYAFGDCFGLWRSNDAGQSWQYLQNDFTKEDSGIRGSAVSTGSADTVAFITSKNLYKSSDGGSSWNTLLTDLIAIPDIGLDRGASPLFFQPGNDNELWLAAARTGLTGKLWLSTNGGTGWTKVGGTTFDTIRPTTVYVRPQFPDQIWVGAVGGLYVSTDHGTSWTLVWNNDGAANPPDGKPPTVVSIARRSDGIGYFAANVGGFRVTATNYANAATYTCISVVNRVNGQGPVGASVLADNSFVTTENEAYGKRSLDGRAGTWTDLGMALNANPTPVYLNPAEPGAKTPPGRSMIVQDPTSPSRWFMTGGKAPVISTDSGATWSFPPNASGLAGVMTFGKIRFPRDNPSLALVASADQGVFVLNSGGATSLAAYCSRTSIDRHVTFHEVMTSYDGQTLVAAGCDQTSSITAIYRSTNGGANWTSLNLASSGLPASYQGVTRAVAAPGNINDFLVLLGSDPAKPNNNPGLYRTTDGGASFTKVGGSSFDGVITGERYHHEYAFLESDAINTNTRYLALRSANNATARGFWRSTDGGTTWAKTALQPIGADWIMGLAVDPVTAGKVWLAGGYRGVYTSTNGGDSWSAISGFTDATSIDAANGRVAVWGRRSGDTWGKLYYSADNGSTWTNLTDPGYRYAFTRDLTVDPWNLGQVWINGISVNVINPPAAWHTLDQSSQFTGNFNVITSNGVAWNAGGYIQHSNGGGYQTSTLVYDTTPNATPTNTSFGLATVKLDFQVTGAGNGLGVYFYNNANRTSSAHYRLQINEANYGGTGERSRWITGANMNGTGGTTMKDGSIGTSLVTGVWYRLELTLTPTGSTTATAVAKIYDRYGNTVLATDSYNFIGLARTTGEIGLSLLNATGTTGQRDVLVDNFRIVN